MDKFIDPGTAVCVAACCSLRIFTVVNIHVTVLSSCSLVDGRVAPNSREASAYLKLVYHRLPEVRIPQLT